MSGGLDALSAVRDAVATVCEVEAVGLTASTRFVELGADSLVRVSIADVVEETIAAESGKVVHIDDALLGRMASLGELADYLAAAS